MRHGNSHPTKRRFSSRIFKLLAAVIVIWLVVWIGFLVVAQTQDKPEHKKECPVYSSEINIFSNFTTKYGQYFPVFPTEEDKNLESKTENGFIGMNELKVLLFVHIYKEDRVRALEDTWLGTFRTHYPNVKIVTFSSSIRDPAKTEKFISSNSAVQKLVTIIHYIQEKYPGYDFYLKFDDDAYVYPHRLMHFLTYALQSKIRSPEPFYGGFKGVFQRSFEFLCGGSGYVFNQAAYDKLKGCSHQKSNGFAAVEDVFFSHWMHKTCGIPYTFFSAFLLGWPEIIMKNFDVDKYTKNRFPLDLPITFHYITPFEMTHFFEIRRLIPKIIYTFEDNPHENHNLLSSKCKEMIKRSNFEVDERLEKLEDPKVQERIVQLEQEMSPFEKQKRLIQKYRTEVKYEHIVSDHKHALKTSEARFPELVKENTEVLVTRVGNVTIVNPVLKLMMLYNTGGILINPNIDCHFSDVDNHGRNIFDDILVGAYELGKDMVVYIDQRYDEIMFIAAVERADSLLMILRDSLFETEFFGFDFGEKHFRRLFHFYQHFMEDKILIMKSVNSYFECEEQGIGSELEI